MSHLSVSLSPEIRAALAKDAKEFRMNMCAVARQIIASYYNLEPSSGRSTHKPEFVIPEKAVPYVVPVLAPAKGDSVEARIGRNWRTGVGLTKIAALEHMPYKSVLRIVERQGGLK